MNWEVFVTCAVTGAGDTVARSEHVPVTPEQIASSAIEAAHAGAAVVHIHVRDPDTGRGARNPALYRAVVERIQASGVDVVLNLTAGMGGDLVLGGEDAPLPPDEEGTDMAGAAERLAHIEELRPDAYIHPAGFVVAAPDGVISRYVEGVAVAPGDLLGALADAEQDKSPDLLTRIVLLCHGQGVALGRFTVPVLTAFTAADLAAGFALIALFTAIRRRRHG